MPESFHFLDGLPMDIFKTLLDRVIEIIGLNETVRLRLVCSMLPSAGSKLSNTSLNTTKSKAEVFDREIPGAIFRSRALELDEHCNMKGSPWYKQIVKKYVLFRAQADGKRKQNLSARLHRILDTLLPEEEPYGPNYQASLRTLIDAMLSAPGIYSKYLQLMDCSRAPTLVETTLHRDCLRAAAVLGISAWFDDIVTDGSSSTNHTLRMNDRSAAFDVSPLTYAAIGGQHKLVSRILDARANACDKYYLSEIRCTLREACTRGDENLVLILLGAYRGDFSILRKHIPYAAGANNTGIFNLLCERLHAPLNDPRYLIEAARYGHIDFVRLCLANGIDVNAHFSGVDNMWELESPLQIASSQGYRDIVQLLLSYGAKGTHYIENFSALSSAASHGHCEIIQDLLAAGSVPATNERYSPLTCAVRNGQLQAVEVLLDSGVELWHEDRALILAAQGGYETIVRLLVQRGVNIDGSAEDSPLLEALAYGHRHVESALLELGAKPVDPLKSRYAKDVDDGTWPMSPDFGVKPMR